MTAVNWPQVPFYITVKGPEGYVLAVSGSSSSYNTAVVALITGDPSQLWTAAVDPLLGASVLTNLQVGQVLEGVPGQGGAADYVATGAISPGNAYQSWVLDDTPTNGWFRIECLPESRNWWLQCADISKPGLQLILAGWDQTDNSSFKAVPETGIVTATNFSYQLGSAVTNLNVSPVSFMAVEVDNTNGKTDLTQTITLDGSIEESTQFETSTSDTRGEVITTGFEIEEQVVPDIMKVTVSGSVEQDTSETQEVSKSTSKTQTVDHSIQTVVTVPAGKKYSYQQLVNYGTVQVPYTATGTFQSCIPGLPPITFPLNGTFSGVNATNSTVTVTDITPAPPGASAEPQVVHSMDVPLSPDDPVKIPAPH